MLQKIILIILLFLFSILSSGSVMAANLTEAAATISNARLSYRSSAISGKTGSNKITVSSTINLFTNDEVCFFDIRENKCSENVYKVAKVLDKKSFVINGILDFDLDSNFLVISKQQSSLNLKFTTIEEIETDGTLLINIPAVDKDNETNDGIPDSSERIITNGFDLNNITADDIKITGCDGSWKVLSIAPGSRLLNHEIKIKKEGTFCGSNSTIEVFIDDNPGIINPAPTTLGKNAGNSDVYNLRIRTYSSSGEVLDNIIVRMALNKGLFVSADVGIPGAPGAIIYGYTSPKALVKMEAVGLSKKTHADTQGYFEFERQFDTQVKEICLTAQDQLGRTSSPTCIKRPSEQSEELAFGPVVLGPTISVNKPVYFDGDEIIISGQTLTNSEVSLSMFFEAQELIELNIIKPVEAVGLPKIESRSDKHGNFSISFPSQKPEILRFFSRAEFQDKASPKSTTLKIVVLPFWLAILDLILLILILFIILLTLYLLNEHLRPHIIAKKRALVLYTGYPLIKS